MRTLACSIFLLLVTFVRVFAQDTHAPKRATQEGDQIKGVWTLNVDESQKQSKDAAIPESEVITIVSQDSGYKLTFDVKQSNGYNPKYDIVTDMKGETVKPINADGRGTNDSWRVTRQGSNAFDMELIGHFGGWTDKYEVSGDGKTMTVHRVMSNRGLVGGRIDSNGVVHRSQYVLVLNREK